jgi:hypothetical protein
MTFWELNQSANNPMLLVVLSCCRLRVCSSGYKKELPFRAATLHPPHQAIFL